MYIFILQYSIPNDYSLSVGISRNPHKVKTISTAQSQPVQIPQNSDEVAATAGGYGVSCSTDGYEVQNDDDDNDEHEYSDEDEYWEPASMEDELKRQLETILQIPVINRDDLG